MEDGNIENRTRILPKIELYPLAEEIYDGDEEMVVRGATIKTYSPYDHLDFNKPEQLDFYESNR